MTKEDNAGNKDTTSGLCPKVRSEIKEKIKIQDEMQTRDFVNVIPLIFAKTRP